MDDGLSSSAEDFVSELDLLRLVTYDDDVDDAEDEDAILRREKLFEEEIEAVFAVFSDSTVVDDDDNDNDNESDSSDDDGSNNDSKFSDEEGLQSHNSSQSDVEQSSVKESYEKNTYDFELKAEIEKANIKVMQYYKAEKEDYAAELRESFQKKWKSGIKELQQRHQNEVDSLKKTFQDQIVKLETEIKTLQENLLKESKLEDVQLLKEEFANEKLALENKNLDLIKNEYVLKSKLSTAIEVEKKLLEKLKKYKKYVKTLQDRHKEKIDAQQKQNEELKKSIVDKESELQLVKHEFDSYKNNLEQTHHKYSRLKYSQSQTEDEVVPRRTTLLNVYEMFTQCLKNISGASFQSVAEGPQRIQSGTARLFRYVLRFCANQNA